MKTKKIFTLILVITMLFTSISATFAAAEPGVYETTDVISEDGTDEATDVIPENGTDEVTDVEQAPKVQSRTVPSGVILSDLIITPISNGQIKVNYNITNNTSNTLTRSNVIAYYRNVIDRSNFLFYRNLQSDVKPGETVAMTDSISYGGIANLPLVLRLLDNGSRYPYVTPSTYPIGDDSGHVANQLLDDNKTVILSNLLVSRISNSQVTVTYTVTNNTDKPVSRSSYISFYKNSAERGNYLFNRNLTKEVPAGTSVTMSDTVSYSNLATYPIVLRLFDNGSTFPYLYPNAFYDSQTDNKTVYEAIDDNKTVTISGLLVTRISNNQVTVTYTVTNNTDKAVSRSSYISFYKNSAERSNYLFNRNLTKEVPAGTSVTMSDTVSYSNLATYPLVLRLFDNGSTFPYLYPNAFYDSQVDNKTVYEAIDDSKTVTLSNLSVSRISNSQVTVTYTVTNNTDKAVSRSSYISFYKNSAERSNYLFVRNLTKEVPAGTSVTMSDTVSYSNLATYPLVLRLFDKGSTFPYLYPNAFYDSQVDNKTVYEEIDPDSTVSISDFSVKKINTNQVTLTYTITNNSNGIVSSSSSVAFYQNTPERTNYLFTRNLGKSIAPGESAVITATVTYTNISTMRIVARLFDNGSTFPYLYPNGLMDSELSNKVVKAASFDTKIICIGDSITEGLGVASQDSYPSQLQAKLGDDYAVVNYGRSGRTVNSKGDAPYINESYYKQALSSEPDIVIIMLGTNDSKPHNWTQALQATFKSDYKNLVQSFVDLPNNPKVYIVTPIGAILDNFGIRESIIAPQIRPQIREVAAELNLPVIEFESVLEGNKSYYLGDGIHPSRSGYDVMSSAFYDILTQ